MVPIFFTLSGFVIYRSYSNNLKNFKDVLRFQLLRFGRLYPVHITFLTIFILIELAKWIVSSSLGISSPNSQPFQVNKINAIFQNIFLVQALIPNNIHTFNGPLWSISTEFYTYFLFALAMLYLGKYKFYVFLSLCFGSLLLIVSHNDYGYGELLSCYFGFF
jgi:peptidoglycan/LPS O-acetylase OafA/YrhL